MEPFFLGREAFASMVAAIDGAQREVFIESYVLESDATGNVFREALERAAGRGVTVRVLADALGSIATAALYWRKLRKRGIEVRLFHPLLTHSWFLRDHRKILVVDRSLSFTGGMNIGKKYGSFGRHRHPGAWRDTHVRVTGSVSWELAIVFSEGWVRAGGAPFGIPPHDEKATVGTATILVLDSRPGRGHEETASTFSAIIAAAREAIWLTNAYFAPSRATLAALAAAARRGVDVRLLLPGLTDVPLVRHAGHGSFRRLLEAGVRIFEYQPEVLHAKTLVADSFVSVIGSTNFDFRSFHLNAECNLVILDDDTARTLANACENDMNRAAEISPAVWNRRNALHKAGDVVAKGLSPLL